MFRIDFYTFQKNPNSTKRPESPAESFDIVLIEPTSIISPAIALRHENPTGYNYAYISTFKRYYFVNDWTYSGGRWIARLNCDVLASWKDYIGGSSQYVVRSAADFDGSVMDTLYPAKSGATVSVTDGANPFNSLQGRYVVGIANGDSGGTGVVNYYVFTDSQFRAFSSAMMGNSEWLTSDIDDVSEGLVKAIVNPFQYIASCMWFPFSEFSGSSAAVKFGWWTSGVSASRLSAKYAQFSTDITLPDHPQIIRGKYLNAEPFTKRFIQWAAFGKIPLNTQALLNADSVRLVTTVDAISGEGILAIVADGAVLDMAWAQIGVPVTIGQMSQKMGLGEGLAAPAAGIIADITGSVIGSGALQSIGNALYSQSQEFRIGGSNGGSVGVSNDYPKIVHEFFELCEEDNEHRGRPLMKKRTLNTLQGFTVCSDSELEAPCTASELPMIIGYLNGGFYYE